MYLALSSSSSSSSSCPFLFPPSRPPCCTPPIGNCDTTAARLGPDPKCDLTCLVVLLLHISINRHFQPEPPRSRSVGANPSLGLVVPGRACSFLDFYPRALPRPVLPCLGGGGHGWDKELIGFPLTVRETSERPVRNQSETSQPASHSPILSSLSLAYRDSNIWRIVTRRTFPLNDWTRCQSHGHVSSSPVRSAATIVSGCMARGKADIYTYLAWTCDLLPPRYYIMIPSHQTISNNLQQPQPHNSHRKG